MQRFSANPQTDLGIDAGRRSRRVVRINADDTGWFFRWSKAGFHAAVFWLCAGVTSTAMSAEPDDWSQGELSNYSVSWIGNSFSGGDAGWVPQDVQDIFVADDGTVFTTVGWEEHRGNIAVIKDGRIVQQSAHWKSGGIDRLVGNTITANEKYVFFATGTPNKHDGKVLGTTLARRDCANVAQRKGELRAPLDAQIRGLTVRGDRVFAACDDNRVRVFDETLRLLGQWDAPSPGEIAADARGRLWVIDTVQSSIRCYESNGKLLPVNVELPAGAIPTDVAVTPDGRLLVADGGRRRQVYLIRRIESEPILDRVIGVEGGVFAGPIPGRLGDDRFVSPIGVGADAEGNIYVACGPYAKTHGGTAIVRCFVPQSDKAASKTVLPPSSENRLPLPAAVSAEKTGDAGRVIQNRLKWRVMSTQWLDTVDFDRGTNGTVLFGCRHRYSFDMARPAGSQWAVEALTVHPDRHPNDPRLMTPAIGGVWHRRLGGRSYLFVPDMNGGNLYVFRFDPEREGETAVFCAQFSTKELWIDANENGTKDAGEAEVAATGECRGWYVDPDGTVWQATLRGGLYEHPLVQRLPRGTPVYRLATRVAHPMPSPLTEIRRVQHLRDEGLVYLAGSTAEAKAQHWKPMGPNLLCYDRRSKPWQLRWQMVLPHETGKGGHESFEPFDFAVEGEYIFVVYAGRLPSCGLPTGSVMVFDKRCRAYLGHMQPSGTRTGAVPMDALQDIVHSINVYRRPDGEYLVFIEDDGYTKNVLYRWRRR